MAENTADKYGNMTYDKSAKKHKKGSDSAVRFENHVAASKV